MDAVQDQRLLEYNTYDDYLDTFVTKADLKNLSNAAVARKIASLGYRSLAETLSQKEFESRKECALKVHIQSRNLYKLFSRGFEFEDDDIFLQMLAAREKINRLGLVSVCSIMMMLCCNIQYLLIYSNNFQTILYLRLTKKNGVEISGYIDFQHSLRRARSREEGSVDYTAIFAGKKRLWPSPYDLGYQNWRTGVTKVNDTDNFKTISNPRKGLVFVHRQDHRKIYTDPSFDSPGTNTARVDISTEKYAHVVFFDHYCRKM